MSIPGRRAPLPVVVAAILVAACGGTTASPSSPAGPSASTAAVPSSVVTPRPTPPTPPPAVPITKAATAALDSFSKLIAAKDRSFHMSQTGGLTIDGQDAGGFSYDLDVVGGDVSVTTIVLGTTVRVVVIGDRMWTKNGDADWVSGTRNDAALADILDVFRYVGPPGDLVYVGSSVEEGKTIEHFRNGTQVPYQTGSMKTAGVVGAITSLGLSLQQDGTPVRITFRSEADIPQAAGGTQHFESENLVTISRWGDKIEITPPV